MLEKEIHENFVNNTVVEPQYTVYTRNSIWFFSVFLTHSVPVEEWSLQVSGLAEKSPRFRNCARQQKAMPST